MDINRWVSIFVLFISVFIAGFLIPVKIGSKEGRVLGELVEYNPRGSLKLPFIFKVPKKIEEINVSKVKAHSYVVYDKRSGATLIDLNPEDRVGIASITKLLTALLVLDYLDLTQEYLVSASSKINVTPIAGLTIGSSARGADLLTSMLVGSSNDSALVLAHHVEISSKKDVVTLMNEKAQILGMKDSHFANPLGFDEVGNYSTAADVKKLVQKSLAHGLFETIGRTKNFSFLDSVGKTHRVRNTNKLIASHDDLEAIKTGYTPSSKGAMITQASLGGEKIVIIVLDSPSRENDTLALKQAIFKAFIWE